MKRLISNLKFALILFILFSCNNVNNNSTTESSDSYLKTDSIVINEMDLKCRLYRSKNDSSTYMRECYWDSLLTKIASSHILRNGEYNGSCKYWTPQGDLVSTGYYSENKKSGKWIFYIGKNKSEEGEYKNGERFGEWKEFDSTGKVIKSSTY